MRTSWLSVLVFFPAFALGAGNCTPPAGWAAEAEAGEISGEAWSGWSLEEDPALSPEATAERERMQAEWEAREAQAKPFVESYAAAMMQAKAEHARVLAARGDARSLLSAAVLMQRYESGDDTWSTEALGYLASAQQRGGEEPLVWWLTAAMCHAESPECDRGVALDKLAALDPDNAAVWNLHLQEAVANGDRATVDTALGRLFASRGYDDYYAQLRSLIYGAYRDVQPPTSVLDDMAAMSAVHEVDTAHTFQLDEVPLVEGLGVLMAIGLQGHTAMLEACADDEVAAVPGRGDACRSVYQRMAEGSDHLAGLQIALAQLIRLHEGDPAQQQWRDAKRQMDWLTAKFAELALQQADVDSTFIRRMFEDGEAAAFSAMLEEKGIEPTPPADWTIETHWNPESESDSAVEAGKMANDLL